ncbi:MAG: Lsr2 family protein [Microthrixaceae bacterium]
MARKIIHQLVDDIDGTVLADAEGETVLFSLDGVAYEIDLTNAHAAELRAVLDPYTSAARVVTRSNAGRKRRRIGQQDYAAVREWARANGHSVSDRGRVPASVLAAYNDAH